MGGLVKTEYQFFSAPLCGELDHIAPSTNYLDWINLGAVEGERPDSGTEAMASSSSDSGLSSDFHYDQQLSPCQYSFGGKPLFLLCKVKVFVAFHL